jgi:large subunit ribosomal protein L4
LEIEVRNIDGVVVERVQVRDDVFDAPPNPALVHQVMVGQLANARQGTASTKTRAEVSGGGRKPFSQKHTGRARQGSIRSPLLRGGGVIFGPHPRDFRHRTPKKMRRNALVAVLSDKLREQELIVVDELVLERPATREMARVLDSLQVKGPLLLVADGADPSVLRSARNIPRLSMVPASLVSTVDLLKHRQVLMTLEAVRKVEDVLGTAIGHRGKAPVPAGAEA